MSSQQPTARVISLTEFSPAAFLVDGVPPRTDTRELPALRPTGEHRHPEAAATSCQCSAPAPCWAHDVAGRPATSAEVAALVQLADGWAPTRCQCVAPEPCLVHPDDRPWLVRPAGCGSSNDPALDSPVARTVRRLQHDRAAGVLPGAVPGQGTGVLPFLTDNELGAWTQALLAEHHRRQSRFADYRRGAEQAVGGMQ